MPKSRLAPHEKTPRTKKHPARGEPKFARSPSACDTSSCAGTWVRK
ncbi:hypothetical protein HMPREF9278_0713 [Mobiluncus mulieris FB024-16]|nr:hypothetical protein HMPREF9278_0713 [Mobiluncus mulieris FB024-16]